MLSRAPASRAPTSRSGNPPSLPLPWQFYPAAIGLSPAPLVLHLHGGAFLGGGGDDRALIPSLLAEAGASVISIDYATDAEHPFPHALESAFAALRDVHRDRAAWASRGSVLFVAGEEAGGNIAAGLAMLARDQGGPKLAGQILLSPMLDPCLGTASVRDSDAGPVGCQWADGWHRYLGSAERAAHPYAAPANASRLAGLPPTLLLTAEDDLMRDEGVAYAARLRDAGVAVDQLVLSGPTGWPLALAVHAANPPPWSGLLRERFHRFLASPTALRGQGTLP
jgi:acetyl esterase